MLTSCPPNSTHLALSYYSAPAGLPHPWPTTSFVNNGSTSASDRATPDFLLDEVYGQFERDHLTTSDRPAGRDCGPGGGSTGGGYIERFGGGEAVLVGVGSALAEMAATTMAGAVEGSGAASGPDATELLVPRELTFTEDALISVITYSALFVIAASGNLTVFVILFRNRRRRSRVNLFIMHLSIADMIVTFIMMPIEIGWHVTVSWTAGDSACRMLMFFRVFGFYLSSFILITISLDRYFAITHPLSLNDADRRGRLMLALAWIVSAVASIPQMKDDTEFRIMMRMDCRTYEFLLDLVRPRLTKETTNMREPITAGERLSVTLKYLGMGESQTSLSQQYRISRTMICRIIRETVVVIYEALKDDYMRSVIFHVEVHPKFRWFAQCVTFNFFPSPVHELAYNLFNVAAMYVAPLVVIIISYSLILYEMSKKSRESKRQFTKDRSLYRGQTFRRSAIGRIEKARIRTLKMTIVIVLVFLACWTPYFVICAWWWIDQDSAKLIDPKIQRALFIFAVSNSCVNPIVYGMYARTLTRELKKCFCCRRREHDDSSTNQSSSARERLLCTHPVCKEHSPRNGGASGAMAAVGTTAGGGEREERHESHSGMSRFGVTSCLGRSASGENVDCGGGASGGAAGGGGGSSSHLAGTADTCGGGSSCSATLNTAATASTTYYVAVTTEARGPEVTHLRIERKITPPHISQGRGNHGQFDKYLLI